MFIFWHLSFSGAPIALILAFASYRNYALPKFVCIFCFLLKFFSVCWLVPQFYLPICAFHTLYYIFLAFKFQELIFFLFWSFLVISLFWTHSFVTTMLCYHHHHHHHHWCRRQNLSFGAKSFLSVFSFLLFVAILAWYLIFIWDYFHFCLAVGVIRPPISARKP